MLCSWCVFCWSNLFFANSLLFISIEDTSCLFLLMYFKCGYRDTIAGNCCVHPFSNIFPFQYKPLTSTDNLLTMMKSLLSWVCFRRPVKDLVWAFLFNFSVVVGIRRYSALVAFWDIISLELGKISIRDSGWHLENVWCSKDILLK